MSIITYLFLYSVKKTNLKWQFFLLDYFCYELTIYFLKTTSLGMRTFFPNPKRFAIIETFSPELWSIKYCKVGSSNISCLEAHAGFFRLLMKEIFDPYVKKVDFLISDPC